MFDRHRGYAGDRQGMSMREFLDWVNLAGRNHHKCRPHLSMATFWSAENRQEAERL